MPYQKGHQKLGGRTPGTPNKRTELWEAFSEYCLNGGLEKFRAELNTLEGKDYVNAYLTLLEFHKPKLARTETKHQLDESIESVTIEIKRHEIKNIDGRTIEESNS